MSRDLKYCAAFFVVLSALLVSNLVAAETAVWIDTDPACGIGTTDDVDDCWALLFASRSGELAIRGISTVFGNSSEVNTYRTVMDLVRRFDRELSTKDIYRGAGRAMSSDALEENEATRALANALTIEPLTIVALGPLTNIATLIQQRPDLGSNIKQVIAVAGQGPGPGFGFYPGNSKLVHLHDLNFRKDVTAFEVVLNSAVPLTLVPYEVAARISVRAEDLELLSSGSAESQWLGEISRPWLKFWNSTLRADGFFPFDSLAIGVLTQPSLFTCEYMPVRVQRNRAFFVSSRDHLLVSHDFSDGRFVKYCFDVKPDFKVHLLDLLLVSTDRRREAPSQ